jgi:phosphonoacetaldehyde hydrolase
MNGRGDRRRFRGPIQAVLFDWAGTVVDFGSRAPVIAVSQTFSDLGVPITVDEARGPMGMSKRDHIHAILDLPRVADRWRQAQGAAPTMESVDVVYREFLVTQAQLIVEHSALIPGCLATIEHCRQRGMRLGSSTGYTRELMEPLIAAAKRQGLEFDSVVCADDVPQGRPAPWMCLENARRLGVFPMDAIVAVDDTSVGIEAGLNAGMWTVGVAKSGNLVGLSLSEFDSLSEADQQTRLKGASEKLRLAGADFVVATVADLPGVLDALEHAL